MSQRGRRGATRRSGALEREKGEKEGGNETDREREREREKHLRVFILSFHSFLGL